ncbi:MAG: histidyl-tRNA synthetase [uncultured bacterium]|nr:MAG: histidyl-tRNA synthetase [uncultured bacterium]
MDGVFAGLGLDITIKINSRRLMNTILQKFGVTAETSPAVIRAIDKLDKIGAPAVCAELEALGVPAAAALLQKLTPAKTYTETLQQLNDFDCSEITTVWQYAETLGVDTVRLEFNPSLARGLDYYTGLIFEVMVRDQDIGSVCGGGRYDNLCGLFSKEAFSGVGVAFGFERIMMALEQLEKLPKTTTASQVLVTVFDEASIAQSLSIYRTLLEAGIASEVYLQPVALGKQFKFADQKRIPFVVVCGPDEQAQNMVSVRIMSSGKQKVIPVQQLAQYVQGYVQ